MKNIIIIILIALSFIGCTTVKYMDSPEVQEREEHRELTETDLIMMNFIAISFGIVTYSLGKYIYEDLK